MDKIQFKLEVLLDSFKELILSIHEADIDESRRTILLMNLSDVRDYIVIGVGKASLLGMEKTYNMLKHIYREAPADTEEEKERRAAVISVFEENKSNNNT